MGRIILAVILIAAAIGIMYAIHDHEEHVCAARGGNYTVVGWAPVVSRRSVSVQPIYGCVMPPVIQAAPAGR